MIELRGISHSFPLKRGRSMAALANINAVFEEGKISVLIGPSGCGKTSLIKIIAGLLKPSAGTILLRGKPARGLMKKTSVIFQDFGLLPWKTVRANAELPLLIAGDKKRKKKAAALLEEFGLLPFESSWPRELSGGMKQRLAIVRALVAEPELLLMDEPFSSLDALSREEAQDFLLKVKDKRPLTIIMVTHSIEEAAYLADSVYVMSGNNPGILKTRADIPRIAGPDRNDPRFGEYCAALRGALKGGPG